MTEYLQAAAARVRRVNGPLVEIEGLGPIAMSETVDVGDRGLTGEVVAIDGAVATVQVYESTSGLAPGGPAFARGTPLAVRLGPWLLGGVFDGLLRPLSAYPEWLAPGTVANDDDRHWEFTPTVETGASVSAGSVIGTVRLAGAIEHRVLVPPDVEGSIATIVGPGSYHADEAVAVVSGQPVTIGTSWPARRPRPIGERRRIAAPLVTGQRVIDALYPIARGSCAAVPGGFGTGKTILLQQIAKWCDADVIVYVGCGERGNEMADVMAELATLEDPSTGGWLAERTVVIANTSNMPMMARETSIYTGVTVAEYFRDMGYDAVVIADSTSRWAEALREFTSRSGELPAEEGYPAGLASALAAFYERAGSVRTLGGGEGSITIVGAVSPPGGDMTEPVTTQTQRFVRCLWSLDRDLAYARHYPALGWADSFSRDVDLVAVWHASAGDPDWATRQAALSALLAESDRLTGLAELLGVAALPPRERIALLTGRLCREGVLQQSSISATDTYCPLDKGAAVAELVLTVADRCQELVAVGVAAEDVEQCDFSAVVRAREMSGADEVRGVLPGIEAQLDRLQVGTS